MHHRDTIRHIGHHGQIMGDHDQPHIILAHQAFEQRQNLRLRCDIKRGCWLIRDE